MIDLVKLITAQRDLQVHLGSDARFMSPAERIAYIKENVLACTDELHEALGEVGWRSWASSQHINGSEFLSELRDAWQFLTNLMLVAEPDPERLATWFADSLARKHGVNYARSAAGYDGVTTKCPSCSRAIEDITIDEVHDVGDDVLFFCACGAQLNSEVVRKTLHS